MGGTTSGRELSSPSARPRTRVRLCGSLEIEIQSRSVAGGLRGRQARLLAAYLVTHRRRAAGRGELIAMLWPERTPKDPQADLRSILSGLRRVLGRDALVGGDRLRLDVPEPVWVDTEAAVAAVAGAHAAARGGDWRAARDWARSAIELLEPGFLPGEEAEWVDARRRELDAVELEALEWVARSGLALGGTELATAERAARQLVARSPYRETGYRYLMESCAAEGNAAEALRVYEGLRTLLRDELGTAPAPELQALHERILRGEWVGVASGRDPPTRPVAFGGSEEGRPAEGARAPEPSAGERGQPAGPALGVERAAGEGWATAVPRERSRSSMGLERGGAAGEGWAAMDPQEEIARLLATLVRLQVDDQAQAIVELGRAGFAPARIGALLGTSADAAEVTLARARRKR